MKKTEIYKKGINDASDVYREKFGILRENISEIQKRQDNINSRNHMVQSELIKNAERMDADLDKIYEILGEERVPGQEGQAVVTESATQIMTGYVNGTLNKYNIFSNWSELSMDFQLADAIASFLTVAVERDMNKKFHKKLTLLEQNGLISAEKFERHKNSVAAAKQLTGLGVYAAFSLAPTIMETINNYLNKKDIVDFVVGTYAYINQEYTPLISYEISCLLLQMDIQVSENKIKNIFEKYKSSNGLSHIPIFSKRNMSIFGDAGKDTLAKEVVSRCDLHNSKVNNRALEFIEDFLRMDISSAKKFVEDSVFVQDSLSDITWFSAINYRYIFLDFIQDVANAQQFAFYDLNNDPYAQMRENRKEKMESVIGKVSEKGLFLTTGKRKDIIDASAKMIQYSINPNYNISMDIKMIKREKKVLELYGL